jgi:hypothetical protein
MKMSRMKGKEVNKEEEEEEEEAVEVVENTKGQTKE